MISTSFAATSRMLLSVNHCLRIILISFLFILTNVNSQYYDEEEVCASIGGDVRNCVSLKYCSSLLTIIRNRPLRKQNLQKLVNLTCEFHLDEPKVCCPLEDICETDLAESTEEPSVKVKVPLPVGPVDAERSFRQHPKFGLLPSFEKCSLSLSKAADKKSHGKEALRGQFPWTALLGYPDKTTGKFEFICGGTIINKRHILTSAQCTQHIGYGPPVKIRLGEHDLRHNPDCTNSDELGCSNIEDFNVEQIIVHEEFDYESARYGSKFEHDIALIRLSKDIPFDIYMQPVCLPFIRDYDLRDFPKRLESALGTVVGWGNTIWTSPNTPILQITRFPIKSNEECAIQYYNQTGVKPTQICAGSDAQTFCSGDSGAALLITHNERRMMKYFQIGIASYGPFNCLSNPLPGLYTRVASHLEWILNALI